MNSKDEDLRKFADIYAKYIDGLYDLSNPNLDNSSIDRLLSDLAELKNDYDEFIYSGGWSSPTNYLPSGVLWNWKDFSYEASIVIWHMTMKCYHLNNN